MTNEADLLREHLEYFPETGEVFWAKSPGRSSPVGKKVGCLRYDGYYIFRFKGKNYYLHRVIWLLQTGEWPNTEVDHINRTRADNRFENLRLTTKQENQRNRTSAKNSSSKYLGVCFHKRNKVWQAQGIRQDGKNFYLGSYKNEEEAAIAYDHYAKTNYGEFASLNIGAQ